MPRAIGCPTAGRWSIRSGPPTRGTWRWSLVSTRRAMPLRGPMPATEGPQGTRRATVPRTLWMARTRRTPGVPSRRCCARASVPRSPRTSTTAAHAASCAGRGRIRYGAVSAVGARSAVRMASPTATGSRRTAARRTSAPRQPTADGVGERASRAQERARRASPERVRSAARSAALTAMVSLEMDVRRRSRGPRTVVGAARRAAGRRPSARRRAARPAALAAAAPDRRAAGRAVPIRSYRWNTAAGVGRHASRRRTRRRRVPRVAAW